MTICHKNTIIFQKYDKFTIYSEFISIGHQFVEIKEIERIN